MYVAATSSEQQHVYHFMVAPCAKLKSLCCLKRDQFETRSMCVGETVFQTEISVGTGADNWEVNWADNWEVNWAVNWTVSWADKWAVNRLVYWAVNWAVN